MINGKQITNSSITQSKLSLIDPTSSLQAATKQYVDNTIAGSIARTYYVSMTGSDSTGTGSTSRPFATIGKALTQGAADVPLGGNAVGEGYFEVVIAAGKYTEDVSITRSKVILRGAGSETGRTQATQIYGNITVNPASAGSRFNSRICLSGLFVFAPTGKSYAVKLTGTQEFGLDIDNCYLYMNSTANTPVLLTDNTNANRCRINMVQTVCNCEKSGITLDIGGTLDFFASTQCSFQNSTASGTGALLKLSSSATALVDGSSFESVNTDAAIQLTGTMPGSYKIAFSNSLIQNSAGHGIETTVSGMTIIMVRNIFQVVSGKSIIIVTAPATGITYANSGNIAAYGTSSTKTGTVTSLAYVAV